MRGREAGSFAFLACVSCNFLGLSFQALPHLINLTSRISSKRPAHWWGRWGSPTTNNQQPTTNRHLGTACHHCTDLRFQSAPRFRVSFSTTFPSADTATTAWGNHHDTCSTSRTRRQPRCKPPIQHSTRAPSRHLCQPSRLLRSTHPLCRWQRRQFSSALHAMHRARGIRSR